MASYLRVKWVGSVIGREERQKDILRGLGLRRLHQERILKNTPAIRGMIQRVIHLVRFKETSDSDLKKTAKVITYKLGPKPAVTAPESGAASIKAGAKKTPARKVSAKAKSAETGAEKKTSAKAEPKKPAKAAAKKKATAKK
jgi:large subunit ribosomal protein L30